MTLLYEVWAIPSGGAPTCVFGHTERKRAVNHLAGRAEKATACTLGASVLFYGADTTPAQKVVLEAAVVAGRPGAPKIIAPRSTGTPPRPVRPSIERPTTAPDEAEPEDEPEDEVVPELPPLAVARDRWDDARAAATTPAPEVHVVPPPTPKAPRAPRKPATASPVVGGDLTRRALACVTKAGGIERLERIVAAIGGAL